MERANPIRRTTKGQEYWRDRIAEQERSGIPIARFCKDHGLVEQTFYLWRKRLRNEQPLRFALVQAGRGSQPSGVEHALELILSGGERLRIGADVNADALRTVLEALRR